MRYNEYNKMYTISSICLRLTLLLLAMEPYANGWGSLGGFGNDRDGTTSRHRDLPKLSRHLRYALFPETSTMGLFLALAIPLDLPHKSVSLSWNFEANYLLPYNASELAEPPLFYRSDGKADARHARGVGDKAPASMDRTRFYALLETHLRSAGLPARACLLRTICEAAETPLRHNGLVGDLLHVLLTPSTSEDEGLPLEFTEAENQGLARQDCSRIYSASCPLSVLDFVSVVIENDIL